MMERVVFVGTGGVGREVTSWAKKLVDIVGYLTRDAAEHERFGLTGQVFPDDITPDVVGTDLAVMTIGQPALKRKLYHYLSERGFRFKSLVHPSAVVADNIVLEEGAIICPLVNVSPNVTLGRLSYVNFCCGIGHDAQIGDFVQINPGVQIGGFARIGDASLVGSGATIRDGVTVGDEVVVGSGSVVLAKIRSQSTVLGNPAKRMRAFEA